MLRLTENDGDIVIVEKKKIQDKLRSMQSPVSL